MLCTVSMLLAFAVTAPLQLDTAFEVPWIGYDTFVYPNGTSPSSSRMADLNGDRVDDLVVSNGWPSSPVVAVLLARGDGGFEPPVLYSVLASGEDVALADFDGDGDIDIVVPNSGKDFQGSGCSLLRNSGDGTFVLPTQIASGSAPNGMAAADLDGDGDIDLAITEGTFLVAGTKVRLVMNNGNGTFAAPITRPVAPRPNRISAADMNADGKIDLIIAHDHNSKNVSVLLNLGGGSFAIPTVYTTPGALNGLDFPTVEIADVDLDGDPDVLYSGSGWLGSGQIALLRNLGNGTLGPAETVPLFDNLDGVVDIAVSDLTGDGWPDLLAAGGFGAGGQSWALVPGDGAGGFLAALERRAGMDPVSVQIPDLDADGDLDVVVLAAGSAEAAVYLNDGSGTFPEPAPIAMTDPINAPAEHSSLAVADIDADGDLDVAVTWRANFGSDSGISVRRGNGDGTFGAIETYSTSHWLREVQLRDIDGDGDFDMLLGDDQLHRLRWKLNDGTGSFGPTAQGTPVSGPGEIETMDANGDGLPDVVMTGCFFCIQISLNTGSGFAAPLTHAVSSGATAVAGADVNGDGFEDLVTNTAAQDWLEVSFGNGDGTFGPPLLTVSSGGTLDIVIEDLDLDGNLDLATSGSMNGTTMSSLIGWGDGQFKPPTAYQGSLDQLARSIVAGDGDGDGAIDLMAANHGSQDISFWRGLGDGSFEEQVRYGVGQWAFDLAFGDFTGDGVGDLLVLVETVAPNQWSYPALVLLPASSTWTNLGNGLAGISGLPALSGTGTLDAGTPVSILLASAAPSAASTLVIGLSQLNAPLKGGVLVPDPAILMSGLATDVDGAWAVASTWPPGIGTGLDFYFQMWISDAAAPAGLSASNGLKGTTP